MTSDASPDCSPPGEAADAPAARSNGRWQQNNSGPADAQVREDVLRPGEFGFAARRHRILPAEIERKPV
ncbi:hypothetical protein [Nocardia lijiangensis]|uniref:hypothetical protein n=1 Tax=Nocardia lijiangensis TaxID=299618 RepID=UPI0008308A63|nr:hypothetical protein [Nocardia lijiangensis]